jgi:hypothetical protein
MQVKILIKCKLLAGCGVTHAASAKLFFLTLLADSPYLTANVYLESVGFDQSPTFPKRRVNCHHVKTLWDDMVWKRPKAAETSAGEFVDVRFVHELDRSGLSKQLYKRWISQSFGA